MNGREHEPTVAEVLRATAITTEACMVEADPTGTIRAVQHAGVIGWESDALVGQPLETIIPERFRAAHRAGLARLRDTGDSLVAGATINVPALGQDGEERGMRLSVARLGDTFLGTLTPLAGEPLARVTAKMNSLVEQVEQLNRDAGHSVNGLWDRARAYRRTIIGLFVGGLALAAMVAALIVSSVATQRNSDKIEEVVRQNERALFVEQQKVLCPLYGVFLDSDTPAARERIERERGPEGLEERDQAFKVIREGYKTLQCAPPLTDRSPR